MDALLSVASIPVLMKPNAGLPKSVDGKTVYDVGADEFADEVQKQVKNGVRIVGGCSLAQRRSSSGRSLTRRLT